MAADSKTENKLKQFAKGKLTTTAELGIQNCVIYTRVSSKEQADTNQSLEWQKKYCDEIPAMVSGLKYFPVLHLKVG